MSGLSNTLRHGSRTAMKQLADRETPFITNAWYVAAFASEIGRTLLRRTILGRPLVFYRTQAGVAVALEDRCVHRSFPLSLSKLDGDTIVCGYHGMRYDCSGRCLEVPSQAQAGPGLGVRAFPLVEDGAFVWIWMGESAADPASIPDMGNWARDASWPASSHYFDLKANYIALHENLLDLSHLSFLHSGSFGTPDYARAPFNVEMDEQRGRFALLRDVAPTRLPALWARPTGLEDVDAVRSVRSEFLSPALHIVNVRFWAFGQAEEQRPDMQVKTAHIITPESPTSTHYFLYHARNFAQQSQAITSFMHEGLLAAFREDVAGLEAIEGNIEATPPGEFVEVSFSADRAGIAMRRYLKALAERERAPAAHAATAAAG
jgi:phenylpropionate dioxygenase-like ring-hydroxylating dioxygenase large terminal subunit